MSLIARLGVVLGLNIEEFVKGTDEATKKTREYQYQLRKEIRKTEEAISVAFNQMTIAAAAVGAALVTAFKASDEIADMAKGFDTTVEKLLATQSALQGAGGNAEDVATMFQKLAIAQDSAREGSDEVREAFARLNIAGSQVDNLNLQELFKEVATALAGVEDAGKRAALAQDMFGKAVKGVNWADFVDKYKEFQNPELVSAIEENAKAWEEIEKAIKEIKLSLIQIAEPFAKLVNYSSDYAKNMREAAQAHGKNISMLPGGLGIGGERNDPFGEKERSNREMSRMTSGFDYNSPIVGYEDKKGYGKKSAKELAADKKGAEEAKRKAEARAQLEEEIKLIQRRADIASLMFSVDSKGLALGDKAVAQEKLQLDLANDIAEIRSNAAKERSKEKAQVDLINKKEEATIAARVKQYEYANSLRLQGVQREFALTFENLDIEAQKTKQIAEVEFQNQMNLLGLEKQRYDIGEDEYDKTKLQVEATSKISKLTSDYLLKLASINTEYDRSAKSAEDLSLKQKKRQDEIIAYEDAKSKIEQQTALAAEVLEKNQKRQHEITIKNINEQSRIRQASIKFESDLTVEFLELERKKYELGSEAFALKKIDLDTSQQIQRVQFETAEKQKEINAAYELTARTENDIAVMISSHAKALDEEATKLEAIVKIGQLRGQITKEQIALESKLFTLDLAQRKGRDIATIQAQQKADKDRLGLEYRRYMLTQNEYNLQSLQLDNVTRLIEAEKKYNDQKKEAKYEMERQGSTQEARENYEQRIKAIDEVRDIELQAIEDVNNARTRNAEADVARQKSFVEGWGYAARKFREDAENAFARGERAFGAVMSNMDAAINNFVETGKFAFEDFAVSVIKDLIRMEMQAQATMLFRMLIGSLGNFSMSKPNYDAGITFNPGEAATGGEISGPTIVGENGPELFIPSQRGTVIPNTIAPSMAGMGQPQVVYNGPYIENMSAIDTQSAAQFLSKNKMSVWAANKSADRSVPVSR